MSLPIIRGSSGALYPYTMTLSFLTGIGQWQSGAQQRWIRQPGALVKFDLPYSGMNQSQKNTVKGAVTSAKGRFDNTLSLTIGATTYISLGLDADEWTATEAETMTYNAPIRLSQSITQNLSPSAPGAAFPTLANGAMCTIGYAQRKRFQTVVQKVEAGPVSTFAEFAGGLAGYPTDGLMGWAPGAIKVCDVDAAALISHFLANWGRAYYFPFTDEDATTYNLTHYASDDLVVRVNGPNDSNLQIMLEATN